MTGEFLDCKSCKCRNKIVDKLLDGNGNYLMEIKCFIMALNTILLSTTPLNDYKKSVWVVLAQYT